jgi:hypothetical protein
LLPNGKVLVAGGSNSSGVYLASAELYDPASGSWTATGSLNTARSVHNATLLPNGKMLATAGYNNNNGVLASAELYDAGSGSWTATGSLNASRVFHTGTLLPNGKVLVAGGSRGAIDLSSAELYDIGLGFVRPDWQPQIANATAGTGGSVMLTGSRFQGISQASGGDSRDSSTNYPVVQLRSLDNSQVVFILVDPMAGWSDTSFTSKPLINFPPGPVLVTTFTNGIPSDSKYVVVTESVGAVVSRKLHNGVPFDTPLPLEGSPGIECRGAGATNDYQIVFIFPSPVVFTGASLTASGGSVSGTSGNGTTTIAVNLTGISSGQTITVTLLGVNNGTGATNIDVRMGVLVGDTNGDRFVNAGDTLQTRNRSGQATDATNFRSDVNTDGFVNSGDTVLVRARSGTFLP